MSRPLRIEFPDALYHVTSRGNAQANIYLDDEDRELYMKVLAEVCTQYNWSVYSWCLMDNHYHLLLSTPDANLSKGMRHLNGVYTQRFNRRHSRVGHLYQGRYKAILVQKNTYLLELSRYIVLNPVRARMVKSAEQYPWSSYHVMTGQKTCPPWFDRSWLLRQFSKNKKVAIENYLQFVADGVQQASPWDMLKNQIYLGNDNFVKSTQSKIANQSNNDIPKIQKRAKPKTLENYENMAKTRNEAIVLAYKSGGYTLQEIGSFFGLHYSSISRIISNAK